MHGLEARTILVGMLLLGLAPVLASDDALETTADKLEGQLMAPCCMSNTVAVHESGISHQMRRDIRTMLAEGKSEQEILDFYVAQYGEQVLAMPEASGFNLMAYLVPLGLLVAGLVAVTLMVRRWRSATVPETELAPRPDVKGRYADRLEQALRELD